MLLKIQAITIKMMRQFGLTKNKKNNKNKRLQNIGADKL
jgi:hypothetical protein